jgi:mannose-1-phosphate guanylyltransferase
VIVTNGDILGQVPSSQLLAMAGPGLTLAVTVPALGRVGTVGIGGEGEVVRLRGEVFGREVRSGDYMGTALVGSDCLESLPEVGCLIGDWAMPHLRAGGTVRTLMGGEVFEDIGTPASYLEAHLSRLTSGSQVDVGAEVGEGVLLTRSFVGSGARVLGAGRVEECVILPGARAEAPLRRAIVTPAGRVMQLDPPLGTLQD